MWIHLLTLELIDGAGGGEPPVDDVLLVGGFIRRARAYAEARKQQDEARQQEAAQEAERELAEQAAQDAIQRARDSARRINIRTELNRAKADLELANLELTQTMYLLIEARLIEQANQRIREMEEAERLAEIRRQEELLAMMPILEEEMAVEMLLLIAIQYRS